MAEMVIDELKQIVRATHLDSAMLTVDDVKCFNADLAKLVAIAAARFGRLRVLVDARRLPIQLSEVGVHFDGPERLLRTPDDRYALVLGSSLAKIQTRRILGDDKRMRMFLSLDAAELWLLNDEMSAEEAEARARNA